MMEYTAALLAAITNDKLPDNLYVLGTNGPRQPYCNDSHTLVMLMSFHLQ